MIPIRFLALLFVCIPMIAPTHAAVTITVGDGTIPEFAAGTVGASIPVYISSNESGTRLLGGYTLGFDFDIPDQGYNFSYFSNLNGDFSSGGYSTSDFAEDPFADNFDFQAGAIYSFGSEPGIDQPSGQTKLFDFVFDISGSTVPGLYDMSFRPDATQFSFAINELGDGTGVSTLTLVGSGGQFRVTSIPEPSALTAIAVLGVTAVYRRRRR